MSKKHIIITDPEDSCYGLIGEVVGEDTRYIDQSRMIRYHVNFKGYDNCIKAGYTPSVIKSNHLDIFGFYRIISDPKKFRMISDDEIQELVSKTDPVQKTTAIDKVKELINKLSMLPTDVDTIILAQTYEDEALELLDEIEKTLSQSNEGATL